jgi:hypothetical protein
MKKIAIWALAALALFAISCDKDNTGGEGDVNLTASALVGEWSITSEDFTNTWVFTSNQLTIETGWGKTEGTYTVENGTIIFTIVNAWSVDYVLDDEGYFVPGGWKTRELEDHEKIPMCFQAKIIYGGSVLIINYTINENDLPARTPENTEDISILLYKKGGSISPDTAPIQGVWHWYEYSTNQTEIRARIIFDGNSFELIITPWSEKYVGSYTYRDGYITCTIDNSYSAYNPETSEGEVDPVTLEATWYLTQKEQSSFSEGLSFPFVVDGDVAYSILANLTFKYHKKTE